MGELKIKAQPIWQPKFSTGEVLVDKRIVRDGKNYLFFCCDRNHPDLYSYDGTKVRESKRLCTNGKIICYHFPLDWLDNEGELPEEYHVIRDREYTKFKKFASKPKKD